LFAFAFNQTSNAQARTTASSAGGLSDKCGIALAAGGSMSGGTIIPTYFGRLRSLSVLMGIASNPISTTRRLHAANGRYVILQYPHSRRSQPQVLACIADPGLYRSVASNSEAWRTVNVGLRVLKNHASTRLRVSFTRLRGPRHAHYRRLLALPLSKPAVADMSLEMAAIARRHVELWQRNNPVDFMPLAGEMMQDFAISLLFGADHTRALPIASMIAKAAAAAWPSGPAYFEWLLTAPKLERAINEWAEEKRGDLNPKDIFSVLVNSPDHDWPPSSQIIGGILTFTFGAAFETCQNALAWTLVLLTQHPKVVASLAEEIDGAVGSGLPSMDKIGTLPLLDGVVKEGMRLFPPVPLQFRRSLVEVELGGERIPASTRVLISAYLINRDHELYEEPNKFKPDRWRGLDRSSFQYPVFGSGGRMCPGALFGNQMVKIALASILLSHRVELEPHARIDHRATITLTPHPGVPITLRERATAPKRTPLSGSIHELVDLSDAS
jgi:cytochrome P450